MLRTFRFYLTESYQIRISFWITSIFFNELLRANCWTIILIKGKTLFYNLSFVAALPKLRGFRFKSKHPLTLSSKLQNSNRLHIKMREH